MSDDSTPSITIERAYRLRVFTILRLTLEQAEALAADVRKLAGVQSVSLSPDGSELWLNGTEDNLMARLEAGAIRLARHYLVPVKVKPFRGFHDGPLEP